MIEKYIKLFDNMTRPLTLLEIELIHSSHNIIYERSDLYLDFILTLDDLIESTYLGHDLIDSVERINHFNWCWNKTCVLINTNLIKFNKNNIVYTHLLDKYLESFYDDKKSDVIHLGEFWKSIFNYNIEKSRYNIDIYIELYKMFEDSYKKKTYKRV